MALEKLSPIRNENEMGAPMKLKYISLIASVLVALLLSTSIASAQPTCSYPPAVTPWWAAYYYSWVPGTSLDVFIDESFSETDRDQLIHGIENWNLWSVADCSNVTFYGFESMHFVESHNTQMPPNYTVCVKRETTSDGAPAQTAFRHT